MYSNVIVNLKKTAGLFLQRVPHEINIDDVETRLLALEPVDSIHHTHVWSLDGEHHVLTTHVVVNHDTTREAILALKKDLQEYAHQINIEHVTVEVEFDEEDCSMKENGSDCAD